MQSYPVNRRGLGLCVLLVILQLCFIHQLHAQKPEHVQAGVLRIKVSEGMARQLEKSPLKKNSSNVITTGIDKFDGASRKFKVSSMKRVFPYAGKFEGKHRKHGLHRWYEMEIDKTIPIREAIPGFKSILDLEIVEPVYKKQVVGASNPGFGPIVLRNEIPGTLSNGTNDPMLSSQWHYNNTGQTGGTPGADISLFEAWARETGSPNVIVAIEDGGIDFSHPDLAANLWINHDEIPNNGIDDDGNGYVDDYNGYSFVDRTGNVQAHDHGTHVAGTVAAVNNNGVGVAGVAGGSGNGDGVRLMSCAVFSYWGGADGFAQAFIYSADNGAVISQNSWSYTSPDYVEQSILDGIDYFIAEAGKDEFGNQTGPMNGGIVIFAAANNNHNGNYWPAVYEPVLSVASTNHMDVKSWYSNYGNWVDIAAPGGETNINEQGVLSTLPSNQYGYYQGTSMACPHASGVAALVVSQMGGSGFSPAMLRARLVETTDNINSANPGYINQLGSGRLNAANALIDENDGVPPSAIFDLSVIASTIHTITLTWTAPADGNRSARTYDLRYSSQPITEQNFNSSDTVAALLTPKTPGSTESFTIPNLTAGTSYYFAIKSSDYHGNTSVISNISRGSTLPPPEIEVSPSQLSSDLITAASDTLKFTILNSGLSDLIYSLSKDDSTGRIYIDAGSGILQPSTSADINVIVKASGLLTGQYTYTIFIQSNDPASPGVVLPIVLNVNSNGFPIASVSSSEINFGTVMVNRSRTMGILVKNEGSQPLELQAPQFGSSYFQSDLETSVVVNPFESRIINVSFKPLSADSIHSTLTINTNDPQLPVLQVALNGQGAEPPSLVLEQQQLNFTAYKGHIKNNYLNFSNSGGSRLLWTLREQVPGDTSVSFVADYKLSAKDVEPGTGIFQVSSGVFEGVEKVKLGATSLSQKKLRVMILSPDPDVSDIGNLLSAYPDLEIGIYPAQWADQYSFMSFDIVILTNNTPWNSNGVDPVKIGDMLADYVDAGGKVIIHQMSFSSVPEYQLKGRFMDENYGALAIATSGSYQFLNLGEILEPAHPVMDSVNFLQYYGYMGHAALTDGSTALANWNDGTVFVAEKENVISLNILPSSGYGSSMDWYGDYPVLIHNAIMHLTNAAPTYLTLSFRGGFVEPGHSIGYIKVALNSEGLAPGNYNTTLVLSTNDPLNKSVIIPVSISMYGEQFTANPDSIAVNLIRGENHADIISVTHNGTESFVYDITVEPFGVQSAMALSKAQGFDPVKNKAPVINPQALRDFAQRFSSDKNIRFSESDLKMIALLPMPAVFNTVYATDFEDFVTGDGNQNGWSTYNGFEIDTTNSYSGEKHLRHRAIEGRDFSLAISPYAGQGPSVFATVSVKLQLQGSLGDFHFIPIPSNGEQAATSMIFSNGGIYVHEKQGEYSYMLPLNVPRPEGYFDLTIETNTTNGEFSIYFDDLKVYQGVGFNSDINSVVFLSLTGQNSDILVDIDDIRIYDGKKFKELPSFVDILPLSGTINPQETVKLDVLLKTDSLPSGTYFADINFFADQDAITVPVIMNYSGSQFTISPESLEVNLLAGRTTTSSFTIVNNGRTDVPVAITASSAGLSTGSQNTDAAPSSQVSRFTKPLSKPDPAELIRVEKAPIDSLRISPMSTLYGTGFEDFSMGHLQQQNWSSSDNCFVDSTNASQGTKHARLLVQSNKTTYASSPYIAQGASAKSSISMDLNFNSGTYYAEVVVFGIYRQVTSVIFYYNSIYVLNYMGNDYYQWQYLNKEIPSSYFNLSLEVDKTTSRFNLLLNDEVIFNGQTGDNNIIGSYFQLSGESGILDLDNFRVLDGSLTDLAKFISFSPESGIIPAGGSLDVNVNITAPSYAGQFQSNILVSDGIEQMVLPLTLNVKKPEARISPDYLYQELVIGQAYNQYLYMENIGKSEFSYEFTVKPNGINSAIKEMARIKKQPGTLKVQPSSSRPFKDVANQLKTNPEVKFDGSVFSLGSLGNMADSTSAIYATSFEEFELGNLSSQQGWSGYGKPWIVRDTMPYTGEKHLTIQFNPGDEYEGHAFSPYVFQGNSTYVTSSMKVNLDGGSNLGLYIVAHSQNNGPAVILYRSYNTVYIYSNYGFQSTSIQLPQGYFDLSFQVNRQNSKLGVFINQELVFSGYAASNSIAMMEYVVMNENYNGGSIELDDVQITDGQVFPLPYLNIMPVSGTLYPYNSRYHTATFDASELTTGTYLADIEVWLEGSLVKTIPSTLKVFGLPEIQVTPDAHDVQIDYQGTDSRNMVIANTGGQVLYFNLGVEDSQGMAGYKIPVARTNKDTDRTAIRLDEDQKLSNPLLKTDIKPLTIVTGRTLAGEQFEIGFPPSQWSVVNNTATGPQWNTASSFGEGNYSYSGEAATVSSDVFGSAPLNTELITTGYDIRGYQNITVQYYANYQNYGNRDFLDLDIRINGLGEWTNILKWNEDHGQFRSYGEFVSVNLDAYLKDAKSFQLRWHYYDSNPGAHDWYAQIDNVSIIAESVPWLTMNQAYGYVQPGTELNLGLTINGSRLPEGSFSKLLKIYSNAVNAPVLNVPVSLYVRAAANLQVEPDTIRERLYLNASSVQQINLSNTGESTLNYSIAGNYSTTIMQNNVSRIYPDKYIVEKNIKDTRVGHPVLTGQGGPDAGGYTWVDNKTPGGPVFNWQDIRNTGTSLYLGDDDDELVTLPFAFPFYDKLFTEARVGSNGYLTFGNVGYSLGNTEIPNSSEPNNMIAAFWDDLYPYYGNVKFQSFEDRFIVQYTDIPYYYSYSPNTFQVILFRNGDILLQYLDMNNLSNTTTGIENDNGSTGLQVAFNTSYISDNHAILISNNAAKWLRVTPSSGTISGFSSTDLNLNFVTEGLEVGDYSADLVIFSNDDDSPMKKLPVELVVFDNYAPVIDSLENVSIVETQVTTVTIKARDADDALVNVSLINKPSFVTLTTSANGSATYSIKPLINHKGKYTLTIEAVDGRGLKSYRTLELTVIPYGVESFSLIDRRNGQVVRNFTGSVTLNKADATYPFYQIRANTNPGTVGSVKFLLNGKNVKSSATSPYLVPETELKNLKVGNHTLKATAYTQKSFKGQVGSSIQAVITIVNQPTPPTGPVSGPTTVTVSPNPVENELRVMVSGDVLSGSELIIYDGTGLVVYRLSATADQIRDLRIDLSGLRKGIYYVQILDGQGQRVTTRLVKK